MRDPEDKQDLTPREQQIARAYTDGQTYKQIAAALNLAPATVRTHLGTIYRKLGVSTKLDLLRTLSDDAGPWAGPSAGPSIKTRETRAAVRRSVTVLHAVVVDLAPEFYNALDIEDAAEQIARAEAMLDGWIARHGGQRIQGGGLTVSAGFGLETADETDAERAVECALGLGRRIETALSSTLSVKVGIAAGVIATDVSLDKATAALMHKATMLAQRAPPGKVAVCARTQAALAPSFASSPLESLHEAPPAFLVAARPGHPPPLGAGVRPPLRPPQRPLLGRDREIGFLHALLMQAAEGEGQLVQITGEAGMGKSSLVTAFLNEMAVEEAQRIAFSCVPLKRLTPLHPVAPTLRALAGSGLEATASLDKVADLFGPSIVDEATDRAALAQILGNRGDAADPAANPAGDGPKPDVLALLDRFLCGFAVPGPLVVVFEDLHWADPMTRSWIARIAGYVGSIPALVILTTRPESGGALLPDPTGAAHLPLGKLPQQAARSLAESVLADTIEQGLIDRILTRAEGNPLYIEEIAKAHLTLDQSIDAVPATLASSLSARLDRLGPALAVAQAASVIGRDFDRRTLAALSDQTDSTLTAALDRLVEERLVLPRPGHPAHWQFRHVLIRDAAYESLLRAQRQALHLALVEQLVEEAGGQAFDEALIAQHLVAGGDQARSVPYWTSAALEALRIGAGESAAAFCRAGREAAVHIEEGAEQDRAMVALLQYQHRAEHYRGDTKALLSIIEEAERYAVRLGDLRKLVEIRSSRCYNLTTSGQVDAAIDVAKAALAASLRMNDPAAKIGPTAMLGRTYLGCGRYAEALDAFIDAGAVPSDNPTAMAGNPVTWRAGNLIASHTWSALARTELGRFDEARADLAACEPLFPDIVGNHQVRLWSAIVQARLDRLQASNASVVATLAEWVDRCEETYIVYFGRLAMSLGPALVADGEVAQGLAVLDRALALMERSSILFMKAHLFAEQADALLQAGHAASALAAAQAGCEEARRSMDRGGLAWSLLRRGEVLAAMGRTDEARIAVAEAVDNAGPLGVQPVLDRTQALWQRL